MANVTPLALDETGELQPLLESVARSFGFIPNSMLTMARHPAILRGFSMLAGATLGPGSVDRQVKQLVALIASTSGQCRYCQAHTSDQAVRAGTPAEKLAAVYDFETSALFSDAERAALRLARDGALVPNATTAGEFETLRAHFSEAQIVEIVAVISLFGFLNRWNDTMATTLEEEPFQFAVANLAQFGWEAGKHR